jgi:N6-adenosine-specific RNA methylase IME4/ParB-like chromosome segregation protein Spo0J
MTLDLEDAAELSECPTVVVGGTTFRLPFIDCLPPLADSEFEALRADIAERQAVIVPIVIDEMRNVIDGANRLRIAASLSIREVPIEVRVGLSDADKEQLAEDLNLHRRHLSREQMRRFVERRLARSPGRSNRQIAADLGIDHKTVAFVRRTGEATGEIPQLSRTVGADGKTRPARRAAVVRGVGLRRAARVADMAAEIASAAAADPHQYGRLLEAVSRTGQVGGAHRNLMVARRAAAIAAAPPPLPTGRFPVIVADPPWAYETRSEDPSHRAANPYPQMSVEAICALCVNERVQDDAVLWLWTTNSHMRAAFTVLDAWGFRQKTILTWAKDRMGTGDWLRGQTEHCLMAVRGRPVVTLTSQTTLLHAPMREHSRKPDEFYTLVENLCPAPAGGRLELFARQARPGWVAAGAEITKFPAEGNG